MSDPEAAACRGSTIIGLEVGTVGPLEGRDVVVVAPDHVRRLTELHEVGRGQGWHRVGDGQRLVGAEPLGRREGRTPSRQLTFALHHAPFLPVRTLFRNPDWMTVLSPEGDPDQMLLDSGRERRPCGPNTGGA